MHGTTGDIYSSAPVTVHQPHPCDGLARQGYTAEPDPSSIAGKWLLHNRLPGCLNRGEHPTTIRGIDYCPACGEPLSEKAKRETRVKLEQMLKAATSQNHSAADFVAQAAARQL